ncbi:MULTISPECIES: AraC family transcriptional regulator [unclassified Spirosoma]|uniref:AraC family transcriptional regulator n=1 Tax=unclassified Spirosoma TaxID=2621999 RepID=UPI000963B7D9|nr:MULTISPECIES: AraC family transcriptional regulator [unclassified Spirosoma]MBN8822763.1 helix-turn-helix transcriptional regulator [Spirosoma sp.]OJW79973.1 MAG: AraC family transcriptional regulator [Spirosoma sp. 48-14]
MKRFIVQEPLRIQQLILDDGYIPVHEHTHYELIGVQAGSGYHLINGNQFAYQAGDLFWLCPADYHGFIVQQRTRFYSLSFTPSYLAGLIAGSSYRWCHIQENTPSDFGKLFTDSLSPRKLMALMEIVLAEQQEAREITSNLIVDSLMQTILSLIDRQLAQQSLATTARSSTSLDLIQRIVNYVCQHITEPDSLRMDKIADVFNYSPGHLGALFKEHVGESIQQYIIRYKLKRVETRLSLSAMTISQIADEFGFADVCHLNKLFKRYYHDTPSNYRRYILSS